MSYNSTINNSKKVVFMSYKYKKYNSPVFYGESLFP